MENIDVERADKSPAFGCGKDYCPSCTAVDSQEESIVNGEIAEAARKALGLKHAGMEAFWARFEDGKPHALYLYNTDIHPILEQYLGKYEGRCPREAYHALVNDLAPAVAPDDPDAVCVAFLCLMPEARK